MSGCYYNENDPFAAAWLRELMAGGHITPGDVDERSVQEVQPDDLRGYTRCHFFAGIGGWDYALQLADWPADRPVWTGSCPCQPFSAAGKGQAGADPRHLWPAWFRLIRECRPDLVFGEQVARAIGHGWLDLVSADLEAAGYAVGACVLGAHSVGAPHRRQRLWFVADAQRDSRGPGRLAVEPREGDAAAGTGAHAESGRRSDPRLVADTGRGSICSGDGLYLGGAPSEDQGRGEERERVRADAGDGGESGGPADAVRAGRPEGGTEPGPQGWGERGNGTGERAAGATGMASPWADVLWLPCRDGKARPTQPGIFPLADGVPRRVGTLRGAGNAICAQTAAAFIQAYLDGAT